MYNHVLTEAPSLTLYIKYNPVLTEAPSLTLYINYKVKLTFASQFHKVYWDFLPYYNMLPMTHMVKLSLIC